MWIKTVKTKFVALLNNETTSSDIEALVDEKIEEFQ